MRIERISQNKIKVTLSLADLEEWKIDVENLSYNSPEAQEMFWNMMKRAESETGFYVDDSQLIVEAMPLQTDGFVIIITRVDENDDFESIHKFIRNKFRKSELRVKKKTKKVSTGIVLYMFSEFEDLCLACNRLKNIYNGESTLYKYKDFYYLSLMRNCSLNSSPEAVEVILSDYAQKIASPLIQEGFLNEHAEKIIDGDAVDILQDYFSK